MSFGGGSGSSSISGSTDVALNSPVNNQVLGYNTSLSKWQNQTPPSGVTFNGSGSGAPVFNVRTNGTATGNGSTDDTIALHAARDAVGTSGIPIHVPAGTYRVNALTLNVAGQLWDLAPGAIIKQINTAASAMGVVIISGAGVAFRGGKVDGNWSGASYAWRYCIQVLGADITVEGVECTQGMAGGITLGSTSLGCLVSNNYSHHHGSGLASGGGAGDAPNCILVEGSSRHRILGNRCEYGGVPGNEPVYDGNGIYLTGGATGGHNLVSGNQCSYNARRGIKVQQAGNNIVGNMCVLNSCGIGVTVSINPTDSPTIISGNEIKDSTLQGLQLDRCSFLTISGNNIVDSGSHGVGASSSCNYVTFTGNTVLRASSNAINLASGLLGWVISGNSLLDCGDGLIVTAASRTIIGGNLIGNTNGGTSSHGVQLIGACDRINLVGNMVGAGVTTGYTTSGTNITQTGNV